MGRWRRFRRNRSAMLGLSVLVAFGVLALFAPLVTPHDPIQQRLTESLQTPSATYWLGTDNLGRDILTRILYGTRISMLIGIAAVVFGVVVGVPLGVLSGFYGGWVDMVVQRIADILFSFPNILLALGLAAALGVSLRNVIIAVGVSVVPVFVRLSRSTVLTVRSELYVEAARAGGSRDLRIMTRHVLPNTLSPLIIQSSLFVGTTILLAAALGFLGLGIQPPTPEWGSMLGEGRDYIRSAPHMVTFPGLAIFLAVLAFNLVGDGLRDALDPRLVHEGQASGARGVLGRLRRQPAGT